MRILLVNKFYYRRGGDCIVTMNLEQLLRKHGHEVAVFAMQYPQNQPSAWSEFWPSNMSSLKAFTRPFGDDEVVRKFNALLDAFRPDVVHLQNIHTQISPIIAELAHKRGIKVFWTLHDTKLVCPCYSCSRDGRWCEECFTDKTSVIRHRCMPGSIPGAVIGYLEQRKWNPERLEACTDLFLPPSRFMADTCIRGGYNPHKFKVLCNFIDESKVADPNFDKDDYYCFLGRLTQVKGISTLCEAAKTLPYRLKVVGGGDMLEELRQTYPDVEFLGQMQWDEFRPILERARFMVIPSEWSENNPLTVIESQSLGTPVLGARIGGIPELIDEGVNGMTFKSGDVADLRKGIEKIWAHCFDYKMIASAAVQRYGSDAYYKTLMDIYAAD